jgi:CheY-like chemotaxis protein
MTAKPKILVVDDEITVVMMMVFLLTRAGFDAQAASNAAKALRLAQTQVRGGPHPLDRKTQKLS